MLSRWVSMMFSCPGPCMNHASLWCLLSGCSSVKVDKNLVFLSFIRKQFSFYCEYHSKPEMCWAHPAACPHTCWGHSCFAPVMCWIACHISLVMLVLRSISCLCSCLLSSVSSFQSCSWQCCMLSCNLTRKQRIWRSIHPDLLVGEWCYCLCHHHIINIFADI